jgi:hypothetical protein
MKESLSLAGGAIFSPLTILFLSGFVLAVRKRDVTFPAIVGKALSVYLLMAIGLKGGVSLVSSGSIAEIWPAASAAVAISIGMAVAAFAVLRWLGKLDRINAGALAAHYGSVSVVTFVTAVAFLDRLSVSYDGFMVGLLALMEFPGIIAALLLAKRSENTSSDSWNHVIRDSVLNPSILVLLSSMVTGMVLASAGWTYVPAAFNWPFYVLLAVFLLEMGFNAGRRFRDVRTVGTFLVGFSVGMPLMGGLLGSILGVVLGLGVGSTTLLAVLAASASYIAAPAAVRMALPDANPGYYITASLGITFPFNLLVGIPLYHGLARWMVG